MLNKKENLTFEDIKDLKESNFIEIGSVIKPHGYLGQLVAELFSLNDLEKRKFIFLKIEGYFVPFSVEFINKIGRPDSFIIKLKEINSDVEVTKIVKSQIFLEENQAEEIILNYNEIEEVINFTVVDKKHNKLGVISEFVDIKRNPVLSITTTDDKELLLPINGINILEINELKKEILISTPEGLIEMMSNYE